MDTKIVKELSSGSLATVRRRVEIAIIVAAVAFLAFLAYTANRLSQTNDWAEIVRHLGPPVGWLLLALGTAAFAVVADHSEKRHAKAVATIGATAAGADMSEPSIVTSQPWRGTALAGLSLLAFSMSVVSSSQLGHLRSVDEFELRQKQDVAWCTQRHCSPAEIASPCNGKTPCSETIEACNAMIWAPSSASTKEQVPIDLSVYCPLAAKRQMPNVTATYGADKADSPDVVRSFGDAKTTRQNERVWRWFVQFKDKDGEQPIDVRLHFAGDDIAVQLVRIQVSHPTTIGGLQESTTAIGGLLTALVGVLGTIGALFKGLRARSATVVPAADTPDASTS